MTERMRRRLESDGGTKRRPSVALDRVVASYNGTCNKRRMVAFGDWERYQREYQALEGPRVSQQQLDRVVASYNRTCNRGYISLLKTEKQLFQGSGGEVMETLHKVFMYKHC
jgi:hypothetical protein